MFCTKMLYRKRISMLTVHVNVYFTDQKSMQRGDPIRLNFEGFEMQKCNIPTEIGLEE